jgi:hypothetical protein
VVHGENLEFIEAVDYCQVRSRAAKDADKVTWCRIPRLGIISGEGQPRSRLLELTRRSLSTVFAERFR